MQMHSIKDIDRNNKQCYTQNTNCEYFVKNITEILSGRIVYPFHRRMLVYLLSFTSHSGLDSPEWAKSLPNLGRLFAGGMAVGFLYFRQEDTIMDGQGGIAMAKRNVRNTRSRIVAAAWELFYENGYDDTTVDDIVDRSGTSKGSFYHYFAGKDALLSSLSTLFDEKYQALTETMPAEMNSFDKLIYLNHELFFMIENSVSLELLARLLSTQLVTSSKKHLMDHNRYYFRLLRRICMEGQQRGELRQDISVNEMVRTYALQERALLYDWCICDGNYSLSQYSTKQLELLLSYLKN